MEDLVKELEEIEQKYTPKSAKKCPKIPLTLHESLDILSKEFDSLGLPGIDVEKTMPEILEQTVSLSRDLVQIHRNTVTHIKDKNIQSISQDNKHKDLMVKINEYKDSLEKLRADCIKLKNSKIILSTEIRDLKSRELHYKEELKKIKTLYMTKEQLMNHNVKKMQLEIDRLKELCGQDIVSSNSKNEVALQLLRKYRTNEDIYKTTIQTLQDNNQELLDQILDLKGKITVLKAEN